MTTFFREAAQLMRQGQHGKALDPLHDAVELYQNVESAERRCGGIFVA